MGIGFYVCSPFLGKRRNFRLPAVGFWSLAFPFFACAGSLPPACTRAPIFLRSLGESEQSAARCRSLQADDLCTGLAQALAAGSRHGLRSRRAADGPHPVCVPCLVQGRPLRDRVAEVARQQRFAQPRPVLLNWVEVWAARRDMPHGYPEPVLK